MGICTAVVQQSVETTWASLVSDKECKVAEDGGLVSVGSGWPVGKKLEAKLPTAQVPNLWGVQEASTL